MLRWSHALIFVTCMLHASTAQTACGGTVTESGAVILSPSYPNKYPNDAFCEWDIVAPAGTNSIKFDFLDFDVRSVFSSGAPVCVIDWVVLMDGQGGEFRRFCGQFFSPFIPLTAYVIQGNRAKVQFRSDPSENARGFRLRVTWSTCPKIQKCSTGRTKLVTGSNSCEQCVCEGCPAVNCPAFCTNGQYRFKRAGQDCHQCLCKGVPDCPALGCKSTFLAGEPICKCKKNTLSDAELIFTIAGFFRIRANSGLAALTFNGQKLFVCLDGLNDLDILRNMVPAICKSAGLLPDIFRGNIQLSLIPRSLWADIPDFGVPNLVYELKRPCNVTGENLQDYADCINGPIRLEKCPQDFLMDIWCILNSFVIRSPLLGPQTAAAATASEGEEVVQSVMIP